MAMSEITQTEKVENIKTETETQTENNAATVPTTEPFREKSISVEFDPVYYNALNKLAKAMYISTWSPEPLWLRFTPGMIDGGLEVKELDSQHVSMLDLWYESESFIRYYVEEPLTFPFAENSIIKNAKDNVTLRCTERENEWVYTLSEGPKETTIEIEKEGDYDPVPSPALVPKLSPTVKLVLMRKPLLDFLRANKKADKVTLMAERPAPTSATLTISSITDTNASSKITFRQNDIELLDIEFLEPPTYQAKATYDATRLKAVLQAVPTELIEIRFRENYPCHLSFVLDDPVTVTRSRNKIDYYLAPQITG
jgi:hypothetical protein